VTNLRYHKLLLLRHIWALCGSGVALKP